MKFKAKSDDNRKLQLNWAAIEVFVARWRPNTSFWVEIKRHEPKRSDPMRAYYFGAVLPPIMEQAGYEKDEALELHRMLKIRYFNVEPDRFGVHRERDIPSVFGNGSDIPVSKKREFVDYVIRQAAKAGIYVPDPGE